MDEAAAAARMHPGSIRRLLESGDLHGTQPKPGARWTIREECLEAYLDGIPCPHRQNVTAIES
ncbi:helix-turn-helix domain-containing protein [Cnuibacter physcomitrellae]|uniref:helix-turn-helix domain-containing protein n=1 Tax=Cnuibacter physcomitrellae TaxID=1619308 RepID=UPI00157E1A95|nr:helix-turn-helix domain-containing protein [Cnuibacter physcomitrellae]